MKPIQTIETLLPEPILKEIASILDRGSDKEGKGVLSCHRSYWHYWYKFFKHLIRWVGGVLFLNRWKTDKESGMSHLTHAILRLIQIFLRSKGE